jgi:hypothetical protein
MATATPERVGLNAQQVPARRRPKKFEPAVGTTRAPCRRILLGPVGLDQWPWGLRLPPLAAAALFPATAAASGHNKTRGMDTRARGKDLLRRLGEDAPPQICAARKDEGMFRGTVATYFFSFEP